MKALVTGASGFIGSALVEELSTLGFEIKALMRKSSNVANLEGLKFERVEGDISDVESLKRAVRGVDYVFHLAGATAARSRAGFFEQNAEGTRNLAAAVAEVNPGITRFVFVSSLAVAGPSQLEAPHVEENSPRPVSAYGESKLRGELELLRYKNVFPISIVRPPIVYGPKDRSMLIFVQSVARNLMPILRGESEDGNKFYSFIHVKDLCRGLVQVALAPTSKVKSGEVFYLSGDGQITYETFMATIAERLERHPLKIKVPGQLLKTAAIGLTVIGSVTKKSYSLNLDRLREVLPDCWTCSNSKAKAQLGFVPEYDFTSGWSEVIDWYKKKRWI